jgi:MFS family permease
VQNQQQSSQQHSPEQSPRAHLALSLMAVSALGSYAGMTLPIFRSLLRDQLQLQETQYGLLVSIGMVPGALGTLLGGLLTRSSNWQRLPPLLAIAVAAAYGIIAVTRGFPLLLAGLVLCAIGSSVMTVMTQNGVVALFPDARRRLLTLQMVVGSCAAAFYTLLAEWLLGWASQGGATRFHLALRLPYLGIALLYLALIPALLAFARRERRIQQQTQKPATGALSPSQRYQALLCILAMTIHASADNILMLWLPRLWEESAMSGFFKPGYIMSAYSLCYVVSRSCLALLPESCGRRLFLCLPGFFGCSMLIIALLNGGEVGVLCYLAAAFLWACEFPAFMAVLSANSQRWFGLGLAVVMISSGLITTGASTAIGWALQQQLATLRQLLLIGPLFFAAVGFCGIALCRHEKHS